jgi:two-component system, NtrC family, nitrogen regulation response regulator GlnG
MAPTQTIEIGDLPAEFKSAGGKAPESDWVRALEREVERAFARGESGVLDSFAQAFEKALIGKALARTGGRRIEAANLLGMGRNTITRKIADLGLDAKSGADEAP